MFNDYNHFIQHQHDRKELMRQVEEDRLARLVSPASAQLQVLAELNTLLRQWWVARWATHETTAVTKDAVVVPEA